MLYPAPLRDLLVRLAVAGLVGAVLRVLQEQAAALKRLRPTIEELLERNGIRRSVAEARGLFRFEL